MDSEHTLLVMWEWLAQVLLFKCECACLKQTCQLKWCQRESVDFSDRCFVFARFLGFRDFHTWVKKSVLSSIYLIHKPYIWQSREGEWKMGLGIPDAWTFPDPKENLHTQWTHMRQASKRIGPLLLCVWKLFLGTESSREAAEAVSVWWSLTSGTRSQYRHWWVGTTFNLWWLVDKKHSGGS